MRRQDIIDILVLPVFQVQGKGTQFSKRSITHLEILLFWCHILYGDIMTVFFYYLYQFKFMKGFVILRKNLNFIKKYTFKNFCFNPKLTFFISHRYPYFAPEHAAVVEPPSWPGTHCSWSCHHHSCQPSWSSLLSPCRSPNNKYWKRHKM